ncbi:hypothetical protein Dda_3705 [Drechslerella dactyloides]|uniref:Uncharacterized protein n=1 Tax=Drechslerella dactyloides TaxID=74499 RepID=A0AAD6NK59_DREDA|nr:hypothetical protein Dda_3705 [Drechslerella dactyloides]
MKTRTICCEPCDFIFTGVALLQEHHIDRHIVIVCRQCNDEKFAGIAEFRRHAPCLGLHASKCGDCGKRFERTLDRDGFDIIEHAKSCQAIIDSMCRGLFFTSSEDYRQHCRHDSGHCQRLNKLRHERRQIRMEKMAREKKAREERERKAREEAERQKEEEQEEEEQEQEWTGWEGWPLHGPAAPEPEVKAHFEIKTVTTEEIVRKMYGIRSALEPEEEIVWPDHMISPWAAAAQKRRERGLAERAARKARQQEAQAAEKTKGKKAI